MLTLHVKTAILSIILFGFAYSSFGQSHKYIPFPDSNYIWVVEAYDEFGNLDFGFQYVYFGKKEIGNQIYNRLEYVTDSNLTPGPYFYYGIRNDTSAKKVYIYDRSAGQEYLLYDFSLSVGDTIPYDYKSRYSQSTITFIDTIIINGNEHLIYYVDSNYNRSPYIEGIGSLSGPIEKNFFFEGGYRLRCTMIQSTLSSYYTIPGEPCKLFQYTGINKVAPEKEKLEIIPNPINNSTIRLISKNDQIMTIEIYTIGGKKLKNINVDSKEYKVSNDFFNGKGIFIIRAQTIKGKIYFKKVINN